MLFLLLTRVPRWVMPALYFPLPYPFQILPPVHECRCDTEWRQQGVDDQQYCCIGREYESIALSLAVARDAGCVEGP